VLSDYAGQVVAGNVTAVRSYWADEPRRIESEVTIENVRYLKGTLPDSKATFTLIVPGGKVDDWQMQIGCAPTFAVGQRWVLFLLPSYKTFPVVGLHQGAFRIESDSEGTARVYDASGGAVVNLGKDGFFQVVNRSTDESSAPAAQDKGRNTTAAKDGMTTETVQHPTPRANLLSTDNVRVQFVGPPLPSAQAMSYDDFVALIRPHLERSKVHRLTSPAGRPVLSPYVAVPMKRAPSPTAASPREDGLRSGGVLPRKADVPSRHPEARQPGVSEIAKEVRS